MRLSPSCSARLPLRPSLAGIVVLVLVALGCDGLEAKLDERRATLDARAAIEAYAAKTRPTRTSQQAILDGATALAGAADPAEMIRLIETRLNPAIAAHRAEITGIVTPVPELAGPHTRVADAYAALETALAAFAAGLDKKNYAQKRPALSQAIADFNGRQREYVEAVQTVYTTWGVTYEELP
jgi:hypothetical protein